MIHGHKTLPISGKDNTFSATSSALVVKVCLAPFSVGQPALQIIKPIAANA